MSPPLAVVVVTRNARERVQALLGSLDADPERAAWEVVVIDNDSNDGTAEAIAARRPWARVLANHPGRGFAGGVNQGIAVTTAPAIAILTASTVIPRGAFGTLLAELARDERVAAVSPLIRFPDGAPQRHGLFRPRPYTALVLLLGLHRFGPFAREADRYFGPHQPGPAIDVDILTGACMLVHRAAYDAVGPFDERFFVYCEDVDWSIRARAAGWRLRFVPEAVVVREKSASSRGESSATIRLYYKSLRLFYAKHFAGSPALARTFWTAGAYLKEWSALAANALRRDKGLRY